MNMPTKNNAELRSWAKVHAPLWSEGWATIGLSAQAAAEFEESVAALEAAAAAAETARQAAMDATLAYNHALTRVKRLGGASVNAIKAYAQLSGDTTVYGRAGVERDAPPGMLPPPTPPQAVWARVLGDGAVELRWKARQPRGLEGVHYQVSRRIAGEQAWTHLGTAGSEKRFTDSTIPAGTAMIEYLLTPFRGGQAGPCGNVFTFRVGRGSGSGAARTAA